MSQTTNERAVEANLYLKIQRQHPGVRWLLQDFESPYEAMTKLATLSDDARTGRAIRRCIEAFQSGQHASNACELLAWIFGRAITSYYRTIGSWLRKDAEQEGSLAVIEVATNFNTSDLATHDIPKTFRKAVIRCVRRRRKQELKQRRISSRATTFIGMGFQFGEDAARHEPDSNERADVGAVVSLLQSTVAPRCKNKSMHTWVRNRLHRVPVADQARRLDAGQGCAKKAQRVLYAQVIRTEKYLQQHFFDWRPRAVAIECLWLAGRDYRNPVAMSLLVGPTHRGQWDKTRKNM